MVTVWRVVIRKGVAYRTGPDESMRGELAGPSLGEEVRGRVVEGRKGIWYLKEQCYGNRSVTTSYGPVYGTVYR